MLTGLFPPTSGDCSINGYSILNQMDNIRTMTGVCRKNLNTKEKKKREKKTMKRK